MEEYVLLTDLLRETQQFPWTRPENFLGTQPQQNGV